MKLVRTTVLCAGAAFALSGCAALSLATKAVDAIEDFDTVSNLTETAGSDLPTSGSATYSGSALIGADYDTDDNVAFVGDAELTATFTSTGGTVVGTLDNFSGLVLTDSQVTGFENGTLEPTELLAAARTASGSVAISDGVIDNSDATLEATASGTISMDGSDFTVSGNIDGQFKGDQGASIEATAGTGFDVKRDGTSPTGGATTEIAVSQ